MPRDGAIIVEGGKLQRPLRCAVPGFAEGAVKPQEGKAAPLAEAAILLGISLGCAVAYSGSSTGKLFMPLGNATEMLATGAA
jgi:hypothetical protein